MRQEALNWWYNVLNDEGRASFPKPRYDEDILYYYLNPASFILPPNITY